MCSAIRSCERLLRTLKMSNEALICANTPKLFAVMQRNLLTSVSSNV